MSNPFEFVSDVSYAKKDLMRNPKDNLYEKDYIPFLTNKAFSYHIDSIYAAQEMNQRFHLDNLLQHDYFINTIRKTKRFSKWIKPEKNRDVEAVMEYFKYGRARANEALLILKPEDILAIHNKNNKGGVGVKNDIAGTSGKFNRGSS